MLNKLDLVPERQWDALEARLRQIEPEAPIVRAVRGDVDLALLFPPDLGRREEREGATEVPPHHHEAFVTGEWRPKPGIACAALREALEGHPDLLRAKGFVETDEGVRLVQVVGRRVEIEQPPEPPPPELLGRIVTIRRAIPSDSSSS